MLSRKPLKAQIMFKYKKRIMQNTKRLSLSQRRFEDIYELIFRNKELIMTEAPTMTRKLLTTYGEVEEKINRLATGIIKKLGVTNRFIGLCGENSTEWIVMFFAILKSGNKPYLINLRQPEDFSRDILTMLDAHSVIVNGDIALNFGIDTFNYGELFDVCEDKDITFPEFGNEIAISTSGTTLNKKACIYTGYEISEQLINIKGIAKRNGDIVKPYKGKLKQLMFLPLYHIFGLVAVFLWYAFFGATFVFLPDMAPESILRTIRLHRVTQIFAVPLLWHSLEKTLLAKVNAKGEKDARKFERARKLSYKLQAIFPRFGKYIASLMFGEIRKRLLGDSVQFCISGGSYIKESTLRLVNELGYTLANGYGMSEIGISSVDLSKNIKHRVLGSIGLPFDSVKYFKRDNSQLFVVGKSTAARLIVNGEEITLCDLFDTGDIVRFYKKGRPYINGRFSDIVFSDDGENLNPDLAEKAFSIPYAKRFSVLGNLTGEKLMLVVEIPSGLVSHQKEAILSAIEASNSSLPLSYRVKLIYFTYDEIMQPGAIKVSRSYLKNKIKSGDVSLFASIDGKESEKSSDASFVQEGEEIRKYIIKVFSELLQLGEDKINPSANFMLELGGSSLDYFTLISELNEKFKITLPFEGGEGFGYSVDDFEKLIKDLTTTV